MTPIKTAVIGAGRWGKNLIRNVRQAEDLDLVVVVDTDRTALHDVESAAVSHNPWNVLADPGINAIVVATPPESHYRLVQQALAAGKHVLCEKPLALSTSHCRELGSLATENGLCLMVDCTPVYLHEVQRALTQTKWAEVREICCVRTSRRPPRDASETLWDLAPHDLAILQFWLGRLPDEWRISEGADGLQRLESEPMDRPRLKVVCGYSRTPTRRIEIVSDTGTRQLLQQQTVPEPLQIVVTHFAECIRTNMAPLTGMECAIETARILSGVATCPL